MTGRTFAGSLKPAEAGVLEPERPSRASHRVRLGARALARTCTGALTHRGSDRAAQPRRAAAAPSGPSRRVRGASAERRGPPSHHTGLLKVAYWKVQAELPRPTSMPGGSLAVTVTVARAAAVCHCTKQAEGTSEVTGKGPAACNFQSPSRPGPARKTAGSPYRTANLKHWRQVEWGRKGTVTAPH